MKEAAVAGVVAGGFKIKFKITFKLIQSVGYSFEERRITWCAHESGKRKSKKKPELRGLTSRILTS